LPDAKFRKYDYNVDVTDDCDMPKLQANMFQCTKTVTSINYASQSAATPTFGTFNFTVASVADFSTLAAAFDQYRVDCLELIFTPHLTDSTSTQPQGYLYTVLDLDDSTPFTATSQAQDYSSCITTRLVRPVRRCWKPRIAFATYAGAFTGFANVSESWIDCASTTVQHYGLKYALDQGAAAFLQVFDLTVRVRLSFRNVR